MGKVYLIGAGPGDEELITLKAIRVLKKCDVVLYDRLTNNNLLKYIREDCEVYYCGKKPGSHYKTQEEINDMLVKFSKDGHTVGRIKGGDPYIFGRGGEEGLRLREEGIEFEVIPGITSPISVLNYSGIPVTHRKLTQSFHVYTGKSAENLNIDWSIVSKTEGTLIFLMGLESLEDITRNLISNGKDKYTPVAVIMEGTTARQKKVIGDLENISQKVRDAKLVSPCMIVIGDVVKFNEKLNWYEKKPLFGLNICITRSKEQSEEIREKIVDSGGEVTEINTIKIINTSSNIDKYKEKLSQYDYIVLTSINAVEIFFERLKELEIDIRELKGRFIVIGPKTYDTVKKKGIIPFAMSDHFISENLLEKMKEFIKRGDKIILPQSKISRNLLYEGLIKEGCLVDKVDLYDTVEGDIKIHGSISERLEKIDVILFTSPSTVRNLINMVGIDNIKHKKIIAIGSITKSEVDKWGLESIKSDECTTDSLIKKIIEVKKDI
ncbi:uroporphyrin-III C-methyltransferase HemD [Gottschalkia acidurici 9a]|uniref:uroporphyrinogen-III C-methyltransferase n=1 Tax=Gottschalkia acidurici (strain ATCC 7906 / DSM 604 / BCRC 14475 / CIP 104303 / KCTC 5404 / NCIMB 10678 / 9a) TaxID=1128398 RepID=K0B4J3_GOTA9|nr:uroporphyrinogen-III C-methyltransferase [Gottschalkia acidurici]AFS79461.1 uroporphyrin-III C-methyltransferase HemD [Gottschalkia acidurici 9a]